MNEYAYRIHPTRANMLTEGLTERESGIIGEHFAYLQDAMTRGVLLMAGRTLVTDERSFGIAVFLAGSLEEAQRFTDADPAVLQGIMRAELFPFHTALWNPSWKPD